MTRVAVFLATAGGAGFVPRAPGTAGAIVGVLIYILTSRWSWQSQGLLLVAISAVGIWAADATARHYQKKDPGLVVIDEVAGQLLTLIASGAGPVGIALGFGLFRAFDIAKPWPVRQFEALPGGTGIMADDLMAGLYGYALLQLAMRFVIGGL